VSRLLAGYRDHPPARIDALYDVLMAVSQMLADLPQLAELDINPLWVDEHGALALDARARLSMKPGAGAESPTPRNGSAHKNGTAVRSWCGPFAPKTKPSIGASSNHSTPKTSACASSTAAASCRAANSHG
jgi:hypothetical protein